MRVILTLGLSVLLAVTQAQAQTSTPAEVPASSPPLQQLAPASQISKERSAKLRLSLTSSDANIGEVVRLAGISICSTTGCIDTAAPSSISLSTTISGRSTVIAELTLPYSDISSIHFKSISGPGLLKGRVDLPQPLKLSEELSSGDVLVVVQKRGSIFIPVAAASNYYQSEGTTVYYNPTFDATVKLPHGVTLNIPAGATASPQVFVVGVHDTGDEFPLVDLYPVVKLAKAARIQLPAIARAAPALRTDQAPLTPRPSAANPVVDPSKKSSAGTANGASLIIQIIETGVVRRHNQHSVISPGTSTSTGETSAAGSSNVLATTACNAAGWCDCAAQMAYPPNQQIVATGLSATGTEYLDWCTTIPPYVHMSVSSLADARERLTIRHAEKVLVSSILRSPLLRISAWAQYTQTMVNGFTWEGDSGTSAGKFGLANGYVSDLGYLGIGTRILGENRTGGGACNDFIYLAGYNCVASSSSAGNKLVLVWPQSGPAVSWLQSSTFGAIGNPLTNSYVSSSTSVVKGGICSTDTLASRWSAAGATATGRVVFMSSTSDGTTSAAELCSVFKAMGIDNAIRLDGGPSAAMTIDGVLKNPLSGLYFIKYGSARYIPYALKISYPGY
jgi:hypothetical protein